MDLTYRLTNYMSFRGLCKLFIMEWQEQTVQQIITNIKRACLQLSGKTVWVNMDEKTAIKTIELSYLVYHGLEISETHLRDILKRAKDLEIVSRETLKEKKNVKV